MARYYGCRYLLSATVLSQHTNAKILNEVSQATVASVSIANQTISVPVLKSLSVPIASGVPKQQMKKIPLNIAYSPLAINMSTSPLSKREPSNQRDLLKRTESA
ncbi:hypothetical protein ACJJTC_003857 [Scirpophaga incertulas]